MRAHGGGTCIKTDCHLAMHILEGQGPESLYRASVSINTWWVSEWMSEYWKFHVSFQTVQAISLIPFSLRAPGMDPSGKYYTANLNRPLTPDSTHHLCRWVFQFRATRSSRILMYVHISQSSCYRARGKIAKKKKMCIKLNDDLLLCDTAEHLPYRMH